jgi:hypothetical protein
MTASSKSRLSPQTEEIIRSLRANLPDLRRQYEITFPGLFGSYGRGEQGKWSDREGPQDGARPASRSALERESILAELS